MPRNRGLLTHHVLSSPRFAPGGPARQRLFDLLSDEAAAVLSGPILPSSWYDENAAVELARAVRIVLDLADDDAFKDYYRKATTVSYSRVYKFLFSLFSPGTLISRAPSVWRRQHDTGEVVVDEARADGVRGRIVGDPCVADPDYSLVILAGMEAVAAMTGVRPVRGTRRVISQQEIEFSLSWPAR